MTGVLSMLVASKTLPALSASLDPSASTWVFQDNEYYDYYLAADAIVVTAVGGVAPYSYFWETISGDAVAFGETPAPFSSTGAAAVIRCQVTDSAGQSAYTNNCTIDP